jgi:hypothetical protein
VVGGAIEADLPVPVAAGPNAGAAERQMACSGSTFPPPPTVVGGCHHIWRVIFAPIAP